jgi:nitrogen regulatory protein PII 2
MKEIIAIVRPKKVGATRSVLVELGIPSVTAAAVIGRGKQRGIAAEVGVEPKPIPKGELRKAGLKYVPKRMLSVVVPNGDVKTVVNAIVRVNQTGNYGDGKIWVCPVEDALRVRTGETGENAVL